jgi:hypothetical protein
MGGNIRNEQESVPGATFMFKKLEKKYPESAGTTFR